MKPISNKKTIQYVCKSERDLPPAEQTIFELKALSCEEEAIIEDMLSVADGSMNLNLGAKNLAALQFGLVAVTNFGDLQVTRDQFKPKYFGIIAPLNPQILDAIPSNIRSELAQVIQDNVNFGEQDLKNS